MEYAAEQRGCEDKNRIGCDGRRPVSYTHLTLPTNREVEISVGAGLLKKKKTR